MTSLYFLRPVFLLSCALCGCGGLWHQHDGMRGDEQAVASQIPNPLYVPMSDREFLWNQLVDTVDDYFSISREQRVRLIGGVLTEGQIETLPLSGATWLEPWREDSTYGGERLYSTLQSMRRRSVAKVTPQADGGYLVTILVYKELEDVSRPEFSTIYSDVLRNDGTIIKPEQQDYARPVTLGWIPMGRDFSLEQRMLMHLRGRLGLVNGTINPR